MEGGGAGRRAAAGPAPLPLPPGFRFRPTDEELLTHYLAPKVADAAGFAPAALREVDLYMAEPWDLLPAGGGSGGEDDSGVGYFFCRRSVKFPSGLRTNRATRAGYWKSTGKDRVVVATASRGGRSSRGGDDCPLGVRKTLVFYRGRAPTGHKTGWVMHEYRLLHHGHGCTSPLHATAGAQSEWVICRMFMKKAPGETTTTSLQPEQQEAVLHPPLDDHMEPPAVDGCGGKTAAASDLDHQHVNCFSNIALDMVPGDTNVVDGIESMLQLNSHGHEELEPWMNCSESTYPSVPASSSAKATMGLCDELAADSFDLLPQLLDYDDEAFPFLHDF